MLEDEKSVIVSGFQSLRLGEDTAVLVYWKQSS
jgi:hypothetical protein